MNRIRRGLAASVLILALSSLSCVGSPPPASLDNATALPGGSAYSSADPLPLAPELTKKTLPNGLTYYVRRNGNPGGRAVMFLIVNSGSTNERDDQAGYAHFVEHMAFNGTASFPENELVTYLRSIGMDFGAEINAHTTREETLYTLQMPLNDPAFFDTGLKVLKEWATAVTFDPVEVEKEKGVVVEELRLGLGPDETARVREIRGLLSGSAHADREPIGTEASIRSASAASLKAFYEEHYRPDRMAVIVVGDIDPKTVSAKIEREFSFPSRDGAVLPRPAFAVSPTTDMGFASTFGKDVERSIVSYRKIVPYVPETVIGDYEELLKIRIAAEAIRMRLSDLSRSGLAEWRDAYFDDDYFYGLTRLYSFTLAAVDGRELEAFSGLAAEVERLRRHGFTESEFKRTVDLYRRWLGTLDVEDDDLNSFSFAEEYVRNFMYGEPVPGIVNERVYIKGLLDSLTVEALNLAAGKILAADEGFVAVRAKTGPGNAALTEPAFEKALRDARGAILEPLAASGDQGGLFDDLPAPGAVIAEKALSDSITELTLSNGARVLLKPTDYDKDAVSFLAWSPGGYSALPLEAQTAASFAPSLLSAAGLGSMSATRFDEETASLNAALQWSIGENGEILVGRTASADLEAFLRLVYLSSAEPGRDSMAFNAARDRLAEQVGPYVRDPGYRFESAWSGDLFGDNPRAAALDSGKVGALDFGYTRDLVLAALADASDFTYVLVGDFDLEEAKALVAAHIGAIPAGSRAEPRWIEPLAPRRGGDRLDFPYSTEDRASVRVVWAGEAPWSWQREATLGFLAQALNNRLLDDLREELGGTYVVSTKAAFAESPVEQYSLIVQFDTDPARVDELVAQVKAEVASIASGAFDPRYADQVRVAAQRDLAGRARTNDYWVNRIGNALASGLDLDILARAKQSIGLADPAAFQSLAAELFVEDRSFVYVMMPE
ncbi:MAG: insulinase family protein [Spirochaetes bacterium]|nr:insulinase family protein [Spirochaetota bacterium]MBU1082344.1 insulinase family protein [Spirochaetota bacterium]